MVCFHPVTGYRSTDGRIRFNRNSGFVDRPVTIACGNCLGCRLEHSRQWAIRCFHESRFSEENSFLTMTYAPEKLPANRSVDKSHWQKFAKRLRWRKGPFRFLMCAEYGPKTLRPHYHAVIFGHDFREDREQIGEGARGDALYESKSLNEIWSYGYVRIGDVNYRSAGYVARYLLKKAKSEAAKESAYHRIDAETGEYWIVSPEFSLMSRRPGLGRQYYDSYKHELYPSDFCIIEGVKHRLPKYYDSILEKEDPELWNLVKEERRKRFSKHKNNNTSERLRVRERFKEAQIKFLKREI